MLSRIHLVQAIKLAFPQARNFTMGASYYTLDGVPLRLETRFEYGCYRLYACKEFDVFQVACAEDERGYTVVGQSTLDSMSREIKAAWFRLFECKRVKAVEPVGEPEKWWMVYNPYPNGKKPVYRHGTFESARVECVRVANLNQQKCHVLEKVFTATPTPKPEPAPKRLYNCDHWTYVPGDKGAANNNWEHREKHPVLGINMVYHPRLGETNCSYCGAGLAVPAQHPRDTRAGES